jgi:hypothetical protein
MSEEKQIRRGGIESQLDGIGVFFLIISIISFIGCLFLSRDETVRQTGLSSIWVVLGIAGIAEGIIFWILFKAGAEIIRLLKKLNGLHYGGSISETIDYGTENKCTECGALVAPEAKFCTQCGVSFIETEEKE